MQDLIRRLGLLPLMFVPLLVWGQATVKGFLRSKDTGEPVMFASVALEGTSFGVISDIEGFYSLSRIPAGSYTLVVSSMEFEGVSEKVELIDGKILSRNFLLAENVIQLGSAEVNADREEQTTRVNMSVETIRPSDLKKIPSFGG